MVCHHPGRGCVDRVAENKTQMTYPKHLVRERGDTREEEQKLMVFIYSLYRLGCTGNKKYRAENQPKKGDGLTFRAP